MNVSMSQTSVGEPCVHPTPWNSGASEGTKAFIKHLESSSRHGPGLGGFIIEQENVLLKG